MWGQHHLQILLFGTDDTPMLGNPPMLLAFIQVLLATGELLVIRRIIWNSSPKISFLMLVETAWTCLYLPKMLDCTPIIRGACCFLDEAR